MDKAMKLANINKILANNGVKSATITNDKKKDGLIETDNSKKIVMVDENRQILCE